MSNEISLQTSRFLMLENNIRTSATTTFNANEAYENTFEDLISEQKETIKIEKLENKNKISFSNLGPPAGFFLDTSLLDENDKIELNSSFNHLD